MALVFIDSPMSYRMGYDPADKAPGGNGYIPISLQYRPYTATTAREHSLACDSTETPADRSYRGKMAHAQNECHLDLVEETRRLMGDKPVIVAISMSNRAPAFRTAGIHGGRGGPQRGLPARHRTLCRR
ncbi:MAG: hypothetical protein J6C67_07425 [Muribaculaceae bacterium]|nr:hypothetical protein [Muribaculaceae bacterium]